MSLLDHLRNLCKVGGDQVTHTIVRSIAEIDKKIIKYSTIVDTASTSTIIDHNRSQPSCRYYSLSACLALSQPNDF